MRVASAGREHRLARILIEVFLGVSLSGARGITTGYHSTLILTVDGDSSFTAIRRRVRGTESKDFTPGAI